jgi:hypothetical protein
MERHQKNVKEMHFMFYEKFYITPFSFDSAEFSQLQEVCEAK